MRYGVCYVTCVLYASHAFTISLVSETLGCMDPSVHCLCHAIFDWQCERDFVCVKGECCPKDTRMS